MNDLMFKNTEQTLLGDIKSIEYKIRRLFKRRSLEVKAINSELSLEGTEFDNSDRHPAHPLQKYDNGRLTDRGVETCYRLFDSKRSLLSVAHLMDVSLRATKHRWKLWNSIGGMNRPKVECEDLPRRKFYRKHND